jgi:hypothetical protein
MEIHVKDRSDITIVDYYCKIHIVENNREVLANEFLKAITQILDKQELDDLLAEHGYVNRDSLIGGGL